MDEDDDTTMSNLTGHEISQNGEIVRKDSEVKALFSMTMTWYLQNLLDVVLICIKVR